MAWAQSLLSVVGVSLASLIGLTTIGLEERRLQRLSMVLVSFAVGALLGDTFLHLVPEAYATRVVKEPGALMLAGLLLFFCVEKLLRREHGPLHPRHTPAS